MKKPWNLLNLPVYSLVTLQNGRVNMNICTYVSAVSLSPKLYSVAVFQETQTLSNIENSEACVLQLLRNDQFSMVRTLGKKSGKNYDKQSYLERKEILEEWYGFPVLKDVCARILLKKIAQQSTGDHELFVFEVIKSISYSNDVLTENTLRKKQIIRT